MAKIAGVITISNAVAVLQGIWSTFKHGERQQRYDSLKRPKVLDTSLHLRDHLSYLFKLSHIKQAIACRVLKEHKQFTWHLKENQASLLKIYVSKFYKLVIVADIVNGGYKTQRKQKLRRAIFYCCQL